MASFLGEYPRQLDDRGRFILPAKIREKLSGTVSFMCDNTVEPAINAASTVSGVKRAANSVLSIFKK